MGELSGKLYGLIAALVVMVFITVGVLLPQADSKGEEIDTQMTGTQIVDPTP